MENIIRGVEGFWSFWGLESIDVHLPKHEWIAETEGKKKLQLFNFSYGRKELEDYEIKPVSFDLLARPIIAATKAEKYDVILSFYRRGCNDVTKEQYIEAIYDFYFVLESTFANGKSKNYAVEKEFLKSKQLKAYVEKIFSEGELKRSIPSEVRNKYQKLLEWKPYHEVVKYIVNIRDFLHHHSKKRKDIWHPEKQDRFMLEAYFLQDRCHRITFDVFIKRTYSDKVIKEYKKIIKRHNSVERLGKEREIKKPEFTVWFKPE